VRDDAALLVSELFGNSVRHSGSGAKGETVTVAVRAAGGVVRVEVNDCGGPGVPQLRPCGSEAEGGRELRLVAELAASWGWRRRADGDLVRAAARLNLPRQAAGPCAGGEAGHAGPWKVHAR
jgi:serine/threonine-protein kinase RsbW